MQSTISAAWAVLVALGVGTAAILAEVVGPSLFAGPGGSAEPQPAVCIPGAGVTLNGVAFSTCGLVVHWNLFADGQQWLATASSQGILFNVSGYLTMDCPILNVTGREAGGRTYSLLVIPVPAGCRYIQPIVLSPDQAFGVVWNASEWVPLISEAGPLPGVGFFLAPALLPNPWVELLVQAG
jgi:hypothetical protein